MRSTFPLFVSVATALALAHVNPAQCTVTGAAFQSYGQGCNTVSATLPKLTGRFQQTSCELSLTLSAFPGCCNTYMRNQLFVLGFAKANTPLAFLGNPNCRLLVQPAVIVGLSPTLGNTLTAKLPLGTPLGTVFVQGAVHYFTTIGFTNDHELSAGLAITLR